MTLVSIPANPVPDGVTTGMLKTPDGMDIRYARWDPPPGRKGTICLFQGRAEFIEKYFETVRDLRARGFAVATIDWRGQGGSGRKLSDPFKGHVKSFSEYETDLETFVREIVLPDCPAPHFAVGHSMGASVLLRVAHKGRRWFDRMVLCAPLLGLSYERFSRYAGPVVKALRLIGRGSAYVPGGSPHVMALDPFVGNPVTSDPVRYARTVAILEAQPSLGLGSPTNSWTAAAFDAMAEFADPRYAPEIRQPIVVVAAGRDEIVSTPAIEEFGMRLRAGSHLVVAGAKHEILMEQDRYRAQFFAALDAFIPGSPLFG